jgi:hypothetical protein
LRILAKESKNNSWQFLVQGLEPRRHTGNFKTNVKKKRKNNLRLRLLFNPKLVISLKDSRFQRHTSAWVGT